MFGLFIRNFPLFDEAGDTNGGGGAPAAPSTPAFDPAAFESKILGEFDKRVNALDKRFKGLDTGFSSFTKGFDSFKSELFSKFEKPAEPEPTHQPEPAAPANPAAQPQQPQTKQQSPDPAQLALQNKLKALEQQLEEQRSQSEKVAKEAAKKELQSSLQSELAKFSYNSPTSQKDLFNLLLGNVQRGEDGNYYNADGVPLEEFVRNEWAARPHYHPTKPVNGSGAGPASPSGTGNPVFDADQIRPGMTREEKRRAWEAIQRHTSNI